MSSTYSNLYRFDIDPGGGKLENGFMFHLVPKASLGTNIIRGDLENSISLMKVKQQCQKLSLSQGPAQSWKDGRNLDRYWSSSIN